MERLSVDDINARLARSDKVSLGGGGRVIWAPEFPQYSDLPGYWDHACYLENKINRLFTITLIGENGKPIPLEVRSRHWVPGKLTHDYRTVEGFSIREEKVYLQDTLASRLTINSGLNRPTRLAIIVWSLQRVGHTDTEYHTVDAHCVGDQVQFTALCPAMLNSHRQSVGIAIGADRPPRSARIQTSEGLFDHPIWETTPFSECFSLAQGFGELSKDQILEKIIDPSTQHWVYLGLEYVLDLPANTGAVFTAGAAMAPTTSQAGSALCHAVSNDVVITAQNDWEEYWVEVPSFRCSDPWIERAYWYRWFGLRLNTVIGGGEYNLPYPSVFEGINSGWFRHAISYSSQVLMRDLRWMKNPELAQGIFLNFVHSQLKNGAFPGAILTHPTGKTNSFYHSNWGTAVRLIHYTHPDLAFLKEIYRPLARYAQYFMQERDPEGWHLYDVLNHWETGQEYMSRYTAVDAGADRGVPIRLKGIDATSYVYELYSALAWLANRLEDQENAVMWQNHARTTSQAVRHHLWDEKIKFFIDLDPVTCERIPILSAVGFYPFMSDLAGQEHISAIRDHLLNPQEFWTQYPLPSTALNQLESSPWGIWKGERKNCPWNGRSWLMTNSHGCEALAHAAQTLDPTLRKPAAELISKCLHEMFLDGDVNRPSSYEYYNPINGKAPFFRGTDDYMHSFIIDLIIQYVAGLQPQDGDLLIFDPLPFDLVWFRLDDVWVKGCRFDIHWHEDEGLSIYVDKHLMVERRDLERIEIHLNEE